MLGSDASLCLHHAGGMDLKAIRRAAEITLRRAILANFPSGPERDRCLEWLERAARRPQIP
jgi:hypothetical protein